MLAREIAELPYVRAVFMLGIIPKNPCSRSCRRRTREDFNSVIHRANDQLREAARSSDILVFWPQRGLYSDPPSFFCHDGTHLNAEGMRKYTKNLRNIIIVCLANAGRCKSAGIHLTLYPLLSHPDKMLYIYIYMF